MVYLARKGDAVVHHTSRDALKEIDGIKKPELEVTDEEFEAAGCLARIVDDEIFIGKINAEKQEEQNAERVIALKRQLADTDYIAVKIAEGSATAQDYAGKIAQRRSWRDEIASLESA
jgi:hypothetical protein